MFVNRHQRSRPNTPSLAATVIGAALLLLGGTPGAAAAAAGAGGNFVEADQGSAEAHHWNQWRGAARDGSAPGVPWPADLEDLELLWQVPLGKSYSGPIVSNNAVFIAETVDQLTEGAKAFDKITGKELWRTTWSGSGKVPFYAKRNGDWIRSTPAFDGEALYVGGMEEALHKLSASSGEALWQVDFPQRYGTAVPDFGFSSSPLLAGGALYVQAANSIVRVDPANGETIWRALENDGSVMRSGAFSSPILATIAGQEQLLVQTREVLYGLSPESGDILWQQPVPSFRGMNILTPTVIGDRIFTSTHRNRSFLYEVRREGEGFVVEEVWTHKAQGYMSSPVVYEDRIYLHKGNGRLTVIDVTGGEDLWTSKPFGDYWSLVLRGSQLLALDSSGELLLLDLEAPEPMVRARREVSSQSTWGHLAASADLVLVRELEGLKVFRAVSP